MHPDKIVGYALSIDSLKILYERQIMVLYPNLHAMAKDTVVFPKPQGSERTPCPALIAAAIASFWCVSSRSFPLNVIFILIGSGRRSSLGSELFFTVKRGTHRPRFCFSEYLKGRRRKSELCVYYSTNREFFFDFCVSPVIYPERVRLIY